jgi:hypothetical protein
MAGEKSLQELKRPDGNQGALELSNCAGITRNSMVAIGVCLGNFFSMDSKSQWVSYWQKAWRERPPAKFFSLYRAIPAVLVSIAQFFWKHKTHSSFADMWIAIAIIIAVYLVLSTLEAIRNFVVISPVNIYSRQSETIAAFSKENEVLKQKQAVPEVSPQERRRREIVSVEAKKLGEVGRKILRYIDDHGQVHAMTLEEQFGDIHDFVAKAMPGGLISYKDHLVDIKPELKSSVEFVLASEYDTNLKAG